MYLYLLLPIVLAILASAAIADERSDKTLTYLLSRPLNRAEIFLQKYLAMVTLMSILLSPYALINYLLYGYHQGGDEIINNLDLLASFFGIMFLTIINILFSKIFFRNITIIIFFNIIFNKSFNTITFSLPILFYGPGTPSFVPYLPHA